MICPSCGRSLDPSAPVCTGCGAAVGGVAERAAFAPRDGRKDALTAGLLAVLLPGMGYVYLGRPLRALITAALFFGSIVGIVALVLSRALSIPSMSSISEIMGGLAGTFLWVVVLGILISVVFIFQLVDTLDLAGGRRERR